MAFESVTSKLAISATTTFTAGFEHKGSTLQMQRAPIVSDGMRGTRQRFDGRTRYGVKGVSGTIAMEPCPEELAVLLPWILGGNASGTNYPLAATLPSRYIAQELDSSAKWSRFAGCYVNRATFSASEGGVLSLSLDIIGTDEELQTAGTFPAVTFQEKPPFVMHDSSGLSSIAGEGMAIKTFELTIDNALAPRFFNSATATAITTRDRVIGVRAAVEMNNANFNALHPVETAMAFEIDFVNGGYTLSFALSKVRQAINTPVIGQRDEILYNFAGQALADGNTLELVTTLDSTP